MGVGGWAWADGRGRMGAGGWARADGHGRFGVGGWARADGRGRRRRSGASGRRVLARLPVEQEEDRRMRQGGLGIVRGEGFAA
jgi:hypothetical protein